VVAAPDLIGARAAAADQPATLPAVLAETGLHLGDVVIHEDHGLGVLEGLEATEVAGRPHELLRLAYAGGSHLAAVEELGRIWRYGSEADAVALDKLNGGTWEKRRAEIDAAIAETARGLVALAKEREGLTARAIEPDPAAYERFAARFAFAETPDQARAVEAVIDDLRSGRPMDRLVVGDVGFGKTEVALRAAAAAALAGHQVAIVAPTTVLVRQHVQSFKRRFKGFGIEVAELSRMVSPAEAKRVKAGLADGSIRIAVGTHALAGKDVRFADLALLVVDEEQRFGTAHKAKLRALGEPLHVLTLTATPIPRTLQGALVGLQQVSVLATPPTVRQPIRTQLSPFDEATVRVALLRERERGGQSFVVVPRVEDMEPMAERLAALVPELHVAQAHGRMGAAEIDAAMVAFADGEGDVLLATNIIESGLDVPCANTMLVWRPDRFGLSQLHQLRGRVGRGRRQGQVYLLTDPEHPIPEATRKRLSTLIALDRLGAGFAIAARDLDLRGAGELLGDAQAGHVKLIGIELYQHLLGAALRRARGEPVSDWMPVLNLELAGWIPADYVPEPEVRIDLYARAARALDPGAVDALADEVEDRFGVPPVPVATLLALARLRALARLAGVERLDAGPAAVALTFHGSHAKAAQRMVKKANDLEWKGERLVHPVRSEAGEARIALVSALLERLIG
jgi:transcription-repair coupling factor (superfamily II helicase)